MTIDRKAYADFLKDADRDDRLGDKDMLITAKEPGQWPSGDTYTKFRGTVPQKVDFNLNPLPSPEELKESKAWETGKKRGVAQNINFLIALGKFYGKTVETLEVGDTIRVKIVKNKEGFLRVASILDPSKKSAEEGGSAAAPKSDVPF